ncbi:MAG: AbrB/MazE/SpoVT family DNA-binding domain-containing protein [Nevskiales bacterium]
MNKPIILDSTGRILLPSAVRRRLNLTPGSRLQLEVVAERIELTPAPDEPETELVMTAGKRRVLKPTGAAFDATAATRTERQSQARRGAGK